MHKNVLYIFAVACAAFSSVESYTPHQQLPPSYPSPTPYGFPSQVSVFPSQQVASVRSTVVNDPIIIWKTPITDNKFQFHLYGNTYFPHPIDLSKPTTPRMQDFTFQDAFMRAFPQLFCVGTLEDKTSFLCHFSNFRATSLTHAGFLWAWKQPNEEAIRYMACTDAENTVIFNTLAPIQDLAANRDLVEQLASQRFLLGMANRTDSQIYEVTPLQNKPSNQTTVSSSGAQCPQSSASSTDVSSPTSVGSPASFEPNTTDFACQTEIVTPADIAHCAPTESALLNPDETLDPSKLTFTTDGIVDDKDTDKDTKTEQETAQESGIPIASSSTSVDENKATEVTHLVKENAASATRENSLSSTSDHKKENGLASQGIVPADTTEQPRATKAAVTAHAPTKKSFAQIAQTQQPDTKTQATTTKKDSPLPANTTRTQSVVSAQPSHSDTKQEETTKTESRTDSHNQSRKVKPVQKNKTSAPLPPTAPQKNVQADALQTKTDPHALILAQLFKEDTTVSENKSEANEENNKSKPTTEVTPAAEQNTQKKGPSTSKKKKLENTLTNPSVNTSTVIKAFYTVCMELSDRGDETPEAFAERMIKSSNPIVAKVFENIIKNGPQQFFLRDINPSQLGEYKAAVMMLLEVIHTLPKIPAQSGCKDLKLLGSYFSPEEVTHIEKGFSFNPNAQAEYYQQQFNMSVSQLRKIRRGSEKYLQTLGRVFEIHDSINELSATLTINKESAEFIVDEFLEHYNKYKKNPTLATHFLKFFVNASKLVAPTEERLTAAVNIIQHHSDETSRRTDLVLLLKLRSGVYPSRFIRFTNPRNWEALTAIGNDTDDQFMKWSLEQACTKVTANPSSNELGAALVAMFASPDKLQLYDADNVVFMNYAARAIKPLCSQEALSALVFAQQRLSASKHLSIGEQLHCILASLICNTITAANPTSQEDKIITMAESLVTEQLTEEDIQRINPRFQSVLHYLNGGKDVISEALRKNLLNILHKKIRELRSRSDNPELLFIERSYALNNPELREQVLQEIEKQFIGRLKAIQTIEPDAGQILNNKGLNKLRKLRLEKEFFIFLRQMRFADLTNQQRTNLLDTILKAYEHSGEDNALVIIKRYMKHCKSRSRHFFGSEKERDGITPQDYEEILRSHKNSSHNELMVFLCHQEYERRKNVQNDEQIKAQSEVLTTQFNDDLQTLVHFLPKTA